MKKGVGIDIIEIDRIKAAVKQYKDKFLNKIFTEKELKYCRKQKAFKFPELAARFAAKEAYSKAIGTGIRGINWKEIEVLNEKSGQPKLYMKNKLLKNAYISISHSQNYSTAVVFVN